MKKIIIAQSHQHILELITALLGEEVGKNTFFTNKMESAYSAVPNQEPYLLITGSVFNTADDGAALCNAAKSKNPNGTTVLLTTMIKHAEMFDVVIDKYTQASDVWTLKLKNVVSEWLQKHA